MSFFEADSLPLRLDNNSKVIIGLQGKVWGHIYRNMCTAVLPKLSVGHIRKNVVQDHGQFSVLFLFIIIM